MTAERKLISFDWAIKRILRNKASFVILEGFLSELLYDDIKIAQVLESESNSENKSARTNRVDLLVENAKGELIVIEIQHDTEFDFLQRLLFGASKVIVEHIKQAQTYGMIKKVISIGIVYFDLGQGEDYAYRGSTNFIGMNKHDVLKLNSTQQKLYKTDAVADIYPEFYILKINKFEDVTKNTMDEWIYFLKNETIKDSFTAKGLKEAKEELDILKLTDQERREYDSYIKDLRYEASMYESHYVVGEMNGEKKGMRVGLEEGKMQGLEEGKMQGLKEGKMDMAKSLKEMGVPMDAIVKSSGLSPEEINAL